MSWWFSTWHFGVQTHLGCDMDESQRGLGATYWVLSLPILIHIYSSSMLFSLFWRGFFSRFFTYFCPHISYTIFVSCTSTVQYHIQVSGSAWSVAKQDGDAACSTTQRSWNLGTLWDDLGRLGTARDGFGKFVGPCGTKASEKHWKQCKVPGATAA